MYGSAESPPQAKNFGGIYAVLTGEMQRETLFLNVSGNYKVLKTVHFVVFEMCFLREKSDFGIPVHF